jgi:fatty acid desaturase
VDTSPLPPAVKGDRQYLSAPAQSEIAALQGARPRAFTLQLVFAWLVIFGVIAWAVYLDTLWATIVAILVVATRHNVLGLLVHDQAHFLGYRGRYGDLVVDLFTAYPLIVLSVEGYAQVHLAHHRDYFGDSDPDFARKSGEEWSFPKTPLETAKLFLADLTGINTLRLIRGKRPASGNLPFVRRYPVPKWVRPLYFVLLAVALTVTGAWGLFLLYWVLPIVTVSQVIVRWGAICEHKYNLKGASVADSTPLIVLSWWERLLLPNLNFAMHPYHHYFPGVSFSLLPKIHEIYCREGLVNHENVFRGYRAYFHYVTGGRKDTRAE